MILSSESLETKDLDVAQHLAVDKMGSDRMEVGERTEKSEPGPRVIGYRVSKLVKCAGAL